MKTLLSFALAAALCTPAFAQKMGMSNNGAPEVKQSIAAGDAKWSLDYTSIVWAQGKMMARLGDKENGAKAREGFSLGQVESPPCPKSPQAMIDIRQQYTVERAWIRRQFLSCSLALSASSVRPIHRNSRRNGIPRILRRWRTRGTSRNQQSLRPRGRSRRRPLFLRDRQPSRPPSGSEDAYHLHRRRQRAKGIFG